MLKRNMVLLGKVLGATVLSAMITVGAAGTVKAERAELAVSDCAKCHEKEPVTIAANESMHKTAVTCLDCHLEHGPWGTEIVPQCSMCHDPGDKTHFALDDCLSCHVDPHNPLGIVFEGERVKECLTCHQQQGDEFAQYPSKHSEQSCNFCHEKHGEIPDCSRCHEPHAEGQVMADCLACHPAHHPLQIVPDITTPRAFCVPCHEEIGELMAQTTTKHQTFTCAFCHRGSHPTVPQCRGCHGEPHGAAIHKKMPECIECHMDAHFLQK
ncbi:MAG: hypothetical protein L3J03_04730 [Desulfobacterales bacterium]|nr:hypothetical protein [Desulfobacterales bacterium]